MLVNHHPFSVRYLIIRTVVQRCPYQPLPNILDIHREKTLLGETVPIRVENDEVFINDPQIIAFVRDIPTLMNVLLYHVVSAEVLAEDVVTLRRAQILTGQNVFNQLAMITSSLILRR